MDKRKDYLRDRNVRRLTREVYELMDRRADAVLRGGVDEERRATAEMDRMDEFLHTLPIEKYRAVMALALVRIEDELGPQAVTNILAEWPRSH